MTIESSRALEYEALRHGAGLLQLSSRRKLTVRGKDRVRFLHNMLTNDILALQPGHGCNAHKVSLQGKMEAAMRVLCLEEETWCDFDGDECEAVLAGLRRRIVLEDAVLEDESDAWALLSLQGPAAAEVLRRLDFDPMCLEERHRHTMGSVTSVNVRIVRSDHTGEGGYDLWAPAPAAEALRAALVRAGAQPVDTEVLDIRRVEAGIPWPGREITPEHFPQEAGLDAGWISYSKGCYLGQETISRIHHLGHVNRCLRGLVCDTGNVPTPGATVHAGDKDIGVVTSAVHSAALDVPIALAYLRREHAEPGSEVAVPALRARVTALPFV